MDLALMKPGSYTILRANGDEEIIEGRPSIPEVSRLIGASVLDTVRVSRSPLIVMLVDDTGRIDGLPINEAGTKLYRAICRADCQDGTMHGDVAVCFDRDFA